MSTTVILFFAIGVFFLMLTGILLTMREFHRLSDDPSQRKGVRPTSPSGQREAGAADTA